MNRKRSRWRELVVALLLGVLIVSLFFLLGADELAWGYKGKKINDFRAKHDRVGLDQRVWLQALSKDYSEDLANVGNLVHDTTWIENHPGTGEIIGFGPDYLTIFNAWKMSSCKPWGTWDGPCPGHREILLDRDFTRMGVACTRDALGTLWCVARFR
jgi:uncharacterized protein YkwD